jgi:hypothetical protein
MMKGPVESGWGGDAIVCADPVVVIAEDSMSLRGLISFGRQGENR